MANKQGIGFKPSYMQEVNELINTSFEGVRHAQQQAYELDPKSKALLMLLQKIDETLTDKKHGYPLCTAKELVAARIGTMVEHIYISSTTQN